MHVVKAIQHLTKKCFNFAQLERNLPRRNDFAQIMRTILEQKIDLQLVLSGSLFISHQNLHYVGAFHQFLQIVAFAIDELVIRVLWNNSIP